jgi:hypothetical protein
MKGMGQEGILSKITYISIESPPKRRLSENKIKTGWLYSVSVLMPAY